MDPERSRASRSTRPLRMDDDDEAPGSPVATGNRGRAWVVPLALFALVAIAGGAGSLWVALSSTPSPPDPAAAFLSAGDAALALDHEDAYEDAIGHYTKVLAHREHDVHALTGLARAHALYAQDRRFEASALERSAADDPALRGEAAASQREATEHAAEARGFAEHAARQATGDADAEVALSDALRLAGDLPLARSRLERAHTLSSPPSAEALRVEALIASDLAGSLSAARDLAERAVGEDPSLVRARMLLARAEIVSGHASAARVQLQAVLARVPAHPGAVALGAALAAQDPSTGDTAVPGVVPAEAGGSAAASAPTIAAQGARSPATPGGPPAAAGAPASTGPRGYDALVREATARLENGDLARARTMFEQALRERPGASEAVAGLGYVMLNEGNARGAVQNFEQAASRGYADALIGLGDAHRRAGQSAEALAAYERYLERNPSGPRASIATRQVQLLRAQVGRGGASPEIRPAAAAPAEPPASPAGGPSDTPVTRSDELPAARESTGTPVRDVPAVDSEP